MMGWEIAVFEFPPEQSLAIGHCSGEYSTWTEQADDMPKKSGRINLVFQDLECCDEVELEPSLGGNSGKLLDAEGVHAFEKSAFSRKLDGFPVEIEAMHLESQSLGCTEKRTVPASDIQEGSARGAPMSEEYLVPRRQRNEVLVES